MKHMLAVLPLLFTSILAHAQSNGVKGYWREPAGSVIHVDSCGSDLCAALVQISPTAPGRVDANNPDASIRTHTLCGLRIGSGFQPESDTRAVHGTLYDPKSGKTYHGTMESHGDQLNLRGYIGISLLGRTEKWTRVAPVNVCTK